jgi:hypothetical protein
MKERKISVADTVSCAFLTPGSEMGKNPYPVFGINIPYYISESLVTILGLKRRKFFVADLGSSAFLILRPG